MTSGAATVNYALYSNAGQTTNWGRTIGADTFAGTGNGAAQSDTGMAPFRRKRHPKARVVADERFVHSSIELMNLRSSWSN